MRCLELAGVAEFPNGIPIWTGGDTVVVQLGDILDRGDAEIATLMLLRQLGRQALEQGGAVHILNGNHESLNVCGDFRCALLHRKRLSCATVQLSAELMTTSHYFNMAAPSTQLHITLLVDM